MEKISDLETCLRNVMIQITFNAEVNMWISGKNAKLWPLFSRIARSVRALEHAGFNVPGRDWVEAVLSRRFQEDKETVARILAYPNEPGRSAEPLKLVRMLGLKEKAAFRRHDLFCGGTVAGIAKEEIAHGVWIQAAHIAQYLRVREAIAAAS